ncbi:hypothetical protein EKO04_008988 [Ascochyta lentis]|uniref:Uncharacterized protein n=1 Tax=Ascochyta lentis TaxID=205686 RepID=A0A8H7IXQ9_9PLEO|nr:hypothetical protein EKO04_008988 [Ascochyta lentis]
MLWRGKHRPQSPSRSPAAAAETKHRSNAMHPHVSDPQIDETDVFVTTHGDSPAPSDSEEDKIETQPSNSTHEPLSRIAKELPLVAEEDLQASKTSETTKARKRRNPSSVTATRSRPQILTLLVCVSYLLIHLLGVDLGLRLINGYAEPRLHRAEVQLHAAKSDLFREQFLYSNMDYLFSATLDRRYGESYEQCLARGLYLVDEVFFGLDFTQNPEVRDWTMEWATDSCGRLLHTPQLLRPETFKFWKMASRYRQLAEKAFILIKYRAALLRCRWFGMDPPRLAAKPIVVEQNNSSTKPPVKMPFGFALNCDGSPPCRLIYSGPSNSNTSKTTSENAVVEARKQVKKWSWPLDKALRFNDYIVGTFTFLQALLESLFLLAILISRPLSQPKSSSSARLAGVWPRICNVIARFNEDEQLAIGLIINTALYALLHYQLQYIIEEFDRPLLPIGAGFCAFHVPQILAFFDPVSDKIDSIRSFCRATKELYMISQGADPPQLADKDRRLAARQSSDAKPASKIVTRFISPLTPISEDIRQEREAMHAEQGRQLCADLEFEAGYATDSDSDYDSDVQHASYVDLTGGATPTISEDGSDWSVVED